jgi:hypothetical protein
MVTLFSSIRLIRRAIERYPINKEIHIQSGPGTFAVDVLRVFGSALIVDQHGELTEVTALTNMTDVWADLWDGSASKPLSKGNPGGAVISGLPVGTVVTRGHDNTQALDVIDATTCDVFEPGGPKLGDPFTVTQKTGSVPCFVRIRYTCIAPVDIKVLMKFVWEPIDHGFVIFV